MQNSLYFIALIPPDPLKRQVHDIKLEMKQRYNSSHALNAPPHITLLSPFRMSDEHQNELDDLLQKLAHEYSPFEVHLKGYSSFPPRVLFIDIESQPKLMELQSNIEQTARAHPEIFSYNYSDRPYHPHMTIAFKDLSPSQFHKAWEHYQDKDFEARFTTDQLCLLRHDGKNWEVIKAFSFDH